MLKRFFLTKTKRKCMYNIWCSNKRNKNVKHKRLTALNGKDVTQSYTANITTNSINYPVDEQLDVTELCDCKDEGYDFSVDGCLTGILDRLFTIHFN